MDQLHNSVGKETAIRSLQKNLFSSINNQADEQNDSLIEYTTDDATISKRKNKIAFPSKAGLFGLDVRFRPIDQKLAEDNERKHKLKKNKFDVSNEKSFKMGFLDDFNRHKLPSQIDPNRISLDMANYKRRNKN